MSTQGAEFLTGKDYPHLCASCRSAIDQAAMLLTEDAPDVADENIEAPIDFVYDHAMYCGGHETACHNPTRNDIEWYFIRLDGEDDGGFGRIDKAIEHVKLVRDRLNLWMVDLALVDDATGEVLYSMRQDARGRTTETGDLDEVLARYTKETVQ